MWSRQEDHEARIVELPGPKRSELTKTVLRRKTFGAKMVRG